jgi:hypothetical protein
MDDRRWTIDDLPLHLKGQPCEAALQDRLNLPE